MYLYHGYPHQGIEIAYAKTSYNNDHAMTQGHKLRRLGAHPDWRGSGWPPARPHLEKPRYLM